MHKFIKLTGGVFLAIAHKIRLFVIAFSKKDTFYPIVIQAILLIVYLVSKKYMLWHIPGIGGADEPSYALFDFSSLEKILGNHRTFGLPLILKIYFSLFGSYRFWPYFQMLFYVFSVLFLYWSFLKFGFDRILSFTVASFLLWNNAVHIFFRDIYSEPIAASFLNITIGSMFLALKRNSRAAFFVLGLSCFYLYQIRPNFSFVALLIPFWVIIISRLTFTLPLNRLPRVFLKFSFFTILPLLLFCLLRFIVLGEFSVVSLTAGVLSGHATYYLDEQNIRYLNGENRVIADEILRRKRRLSYPCNLAPFSGNELSSRQRFELEELCMPPTVMTSLLVAVKYQYGLEPFSEGDKNIEAWKYVDTLSGFFSFTYNYITERLLKNYTSEVLKIERKQYFSWLQRGIYYSMQEYVSSIYNYFYFLFLISAIAFQVSLKMKRPDSRLLDIWRKQLIIFNMIAVSIFLLGYIPGVAINYTFPRLMGLLALYLPASLFLWVLPPFWLNSGKNEFL